MLLQVRKCRYNAKDSLGREFENRYPARLTISSIRNKFEADGTVRNVHLQRSERLRSSTNSDNEERLG